MGKPSRLIGIEEHFITSDFSAHQPRPGRLDDIDSYRIEEMDRNGIDMQILSLTGPGVQGEADASTATIKAKRANDFLAEVIHRHPTRFSGLAAVALQNPGEAAAELERAVVQLGLKGALINNHTNGEYLDEDKFSPLWERAQALDVPIFLHPFFSPQPWGVFNGYRELASSVWGWGAEAAAHALRIVCGGVFDRFPRSKLILGHMGEMLPFWLYRIDSRWKIQPQKRALKKLPAQYIRDNVLISTSGVFSDEPLLCSIGAIGVDSIMFAVDYPYESTEEAIAFIANAPLKQEEIEKIAHLNASRLFHL